MIGVLIGASSAAAVFFYDGGGRVNVLAVLGIFVLLPLLTLVLFVLSAASRNPPGGLHLGQLGRIVIRLLPVPGAHGLAALAGGRAGARVSRWLLLCWSQWLALGFSIGALACAFALVLFSDIAFGWSTTLAVEPAQIAALAHALAWPWASLAPAAVPDAALVDTSRYFRLAFAGAMRPDPAALGRWWPFVLLCMLCYGVIPRLFTLALARRRLRAACTAALLADRRVRALLDRMNTPLVETRAPNAETRADAPPAPAALADLPPADGYRVVNWAALPLDEAAIGRMLGASRLIASFTAGGNRSTTQDRELIGTLSGNGDAVLILTKAWEPPTLELIDFVGELRAALPARIALALAPVMVRDGAAAAAGQAPLATWQQALAGLEQVSLVRLHPEPAR